LERASSFDDLLVNTVRRVDCGRWFSSRLVLLGDAASAMAPNLGQGANSALVDGVVLGDALLAALPRFPRLSEEGIHRALAADVRAVRSAYLLGDTR
jgi:2-polyprenyl-6-methoxyphenol hydroxylase-like FAD-dependent oxidoreductase